MITNHSSQFIFQQITHLLNHLTNEQYCMPIEVLGGSSIGQHTRHIFDFYNCISLSALTGQLDYSCRDRNPDIETNIAITLNLFSDLTEKLTKFNSYQQVNVLSEYSTDLQEEREWLNSSIGRELMYGFDHAIHHLAIIKVGLTAQFPSIVLPKDLGVAPSTIKYHKEIHNH